MIIFINPNEILDPTQMNEGMGKIWVNEYRDHRIWSYGDKFHNILPESYPILYKYMYTYIGKKINLVPNI